MPDKKRDPEIEALEAVHAALKPLAAVDRTKVLASVYALLGIQGSDVIAVPAVVLGQVPATPTTVSQLGTPARSPVRPLSINELVQERSPGTNSQRITLFAYYRDKVEGVPRFSRDGLKEYFAKAKQVPPTNYDRDFVEAVKRGWIHEDGDDSYVTSKGIEAVESSFAGERKYTKRPGSPRKARRPKAAAKATTKPQRKSRGSR